MGEGWSLVRVLVVLAVVLGSVGKGAWAQEADRDGDTADPSAPIEVVPGQVGVRVRPLADGLIRDGAWSMVRVTLANGGETTRARVSLRERTKLDEGARSFVRIVDLPRGSRKDVHLPWMAGNSPRDRTVEVEIGGEITSVVFPVRLLHDADVGIGVVGEDALGIPAVTEAWEGPVPGRVPRPRAQSLRRVRVGLLPLGDLPEASSGYGALDWVVWPGADPSALDARQIDALLAWTAAGGHLFLSVTDTWRALAGSPLDEALPVDLLGVSDGTVDALVAALGGDADGGTVPAATALPRPGDDQNAIVLALLDDGRPAWVAGSYGLGTVHVLLVDPSVGPMRRRVAREDLWRHLLWLPPPGAEIGWLSVGPPDLATWVDFGTPYFSDTIAADRLRSGGPRLAVDLGLACPTSRCFPVQGPSPFQRVGGWYGVEGGDRIRDRMRELLADIPGVAPLPLSWLALFAGVYLLVIGPLDYLVLRLLRRQPLTWITFPLAVAVFSAVALVGTSIVKGSQAIVTRYDVVDVLPGTGFWRGQTWLGIFATRKTDLSLASGFDDAVVMPVGDGGFLQDASTFGGEGSVRLAWRAQTWSLAYVQTAWTARQTGGVTVRPLPGGAVEIANGLGVDLDAAELRARGRRWTFGAFPAGTSRRIVVGDEGVPTLEDLAAFVAREGWPADRGEYREARFGLSMLSAYPEDRGGHLAIEAPVGFVGRASVAFEPILLEGLAPVERPHTVFRVPLTLAPVAVEDP